MKTYAVNDFNKNPLVYPKPARRRARRVAGSEGVECEGEEYGVLPLICVSSKGTER